jgi:hypothetical protein
MAASVPVYAKWWLGKEGEPRCHQLPRLMDVNSRMVMSADPLGGRDSLLMRMRTLFHRFVLAQMGQVKPIVRLERFPGNLRMLFNTDIDPPELKTIH